MATHAADILAFHTSGAVARSLSSSSDDDDDDGVREMNAGNASIRLNQEKVKIKV